MRWLKLFEEVCLLGRFSVGYVKIEMPSDMKKNVAVEYTI